MNRPLRLVAFLVCLSLATGCGEAETQTAPTQTNPTTTTTFTSTTITTTSSAITTTTTTISTTATTTTTTTTSKKSTTTTTKKTKRTTTTTKTTGTTKKEHQTSGKKVLSVPIIPQKPDFPSGCESVSTVMALRYYGETVSVHEFIDEHLPKSSKFYWKNQKEYGPNPYERFVGSPYTTQAYGCMSPVIKKALISYFGNDERIQVATGQSLNTLCKKYIDQDIPVIVWVTIGMLETYVSDTWYLEDGTLYEWPANEHCMLLVGYDDNYYYFNDPYRGQVKKYARWLAERRYKDMGMQAIAITD